MSDSEEEEYQYDYSDSEDDTKMANAPLSTPTPTRDLTLSSHNAKLVHTRSFLNAAPKNQHAWVKFCLDLVERCESFLGEGTGGWKKWFDSDPSTSTSTTTTTTPPPSTTPSTPSNPSTPSTPSTPLTPEHGVLQHRMETLHEKLHLLHYHHKLAAAGRPPLLRTHFSQENGGVSPGTLNRRQQFLDFLLLTEFLLDEIDLKQHLVSDTETPNAIATALLNALSKAGAPADKMEAITPMSLTPGFGFGVVDIVEFLVDKSLSDGRYSYDGVRRLNNEEEEEDDNNGGNAEEKNDDDSEDEIEDEVEDMQVRRAARNIHAHSHARAPHNIC